MNALGAIGIARTFNYGGHIGRDLYDPNIKLNLKMTKKSNIKMYRSDFKSFLRKTTVT